MAASVSTPQFTNYELFDAFRKLIEKGGLFHEAAGMNMKVYSWKKIPNRPAGQVRGGSFFWRRQWPAVGMKAVLSQSDSEDLITSVIVVGRKSYRISSGNIVAHKETPTLDAIKNALAKTTA